MRAINKRKLNALDGHKLKPQSRPYLVWDTLQRGLALQVQPTGFRAYKFIYAFRNRTRWITIGPADAIGLVDARRRAAELMLEVLNGNDPAGDRHATSTSFAALATRYLEEYAKRRNKSWRQADKLISRHVLPAWTDCDASTITRADVRALFAGIAAPVLANQVLAAISAIFAWAVKQELLTNNPCRGIERNATQSRERVLSDAEVPLFWSEFGKAGIPGLALQVLLLTGQRPGEVKHMRYDQITDGWWTLPGAPDPATRWPGTKNAQTHRVWLPARVQEMLAELGDEQSGFVFDRPRALDETMRDICKALNVPRATPHDLRRTHGTTITGLGFGKDAMNRVQNHKEGGIASVYDRHEYADENKRIMEAVAARLITLAEGAPSTNVISFNNQQR